MKWVIEYWQRVAPYLGKLWLATAFLLVAGLSFEAGLLHKGLQESAPVIVTVPSVLPAAAVPARQDVIPSSSTHTKTVNASPTASRTSSTTDCAFVGSKKSNKYHAPTSRCAKQIKPENRLCFASVEAATAKGYLAGCLE